LPAAVLLATVLIEAVRSDARSLEVAAIEPAESPAAASLGDALAFL
jgi:hypothetical protein